MSKRQVTQNRWRLASGSGRSKPGLIYLVLLGLTLLLFGKIGSGHGMRVRARPPRNAGRGRVLLSGLDEVFAVSSTAQKSDPALWEKIKHEVTEGDRGGKPGQWSARKAQLAVHDYKEAGGGYTGAKADDNHLHQWTEEHWGTKSGKPSAETGERYLPEQAREHLTKEEYARTTAKKRADTRKGKQFSAQPADIARKTAQDRDTGHSADLQRLSRKDLLDRAARAKVAGRSRMNKAQLVEALRDG